MVLLVWPLSLSSVILYLRNVVVSRPAVLSIVIFIDNKYYSLHRDDRGDISKLEVRKDTENAKTWPQRKVASSGLKARVYFKVQHFLVIFHLPECSLN